MTTEREYDEDEVRQILDLAVTLDQSSQPAVTPGGSAGTGRGLTLAQIQDIGREVGVDPQRIEQAARAVAVRGDALPRRTSMGMPIAVGRTVELPRALTDREWELLVVDLRETFGARGRVRSEGGIREWWNGNLHALVEPTPRGYRLRLGTLNGAGVARNRLGVIALLVGGLGLAMVSIPAGGSYEVVIPAALGLAALGSNLVRLPRWARTREQQMERIAQRVAGLLGSAPQPQG